METSDPAIPDAPAVAGAWWSAFVDDAGLFPPESLSMPRALARYRDNLAQANEPGGDVLSHRFICPVDGIGHLLDHLEADDAIRLILLGPLDVTLVEDLTATVHAIEVVGWETKVGPDTAEGLQHFRASVAGRRTPVSVEVPTSDPVADLEHRLDQVMGWDVHAKVRCGGPHAEDFPTPGALAAFIVGCVRRGVPFKATAGLHHPLANRDEATGHEHFGFLNLLAATAQARLGESIEEVAEVLTMRALPTNVDAWPDARSAFVSFGSCSTSEPVEDLMALGLLPGEAR